MSVKQKVFDLLWGAEGAVSGSELAKALGVSRNAIWKAVKGLEQDGCVIEAVTNRGYRLLSCGERLFEGMIRRNLKAEKLGQDIQIHPTLASTNDHIKGLAIAGAKHGTVVLAENQTVGKGRRGRHFFSPAGGIYMSVLLRPSFSTETAGLVTSCAAVAVAEAIEALDGPEIGIKWVNDLYAGGRKLCGILTEGAADLESGCMEYVIVGIGINVGQTEFPDELREIATSIYNECGRVTDRNRLIAEILNRLEPAIEAIESRDFIRESRRRSVVLGKEITVISASRQYDAVAVDVDENGHLLVEADGRIIRLNSGEISVKTKG